MCENCEEDGIDEGQPIGYVPEQLSLTDVVVIGVRWVGNVLETTAGAVHALANLGVRHDLWQRQRGQFAATAGLEIEMLTAPMPEDEA